MKNLLLLAALAAGGYYAYHKWLAPQQAALATNPALAEVAPPGPVDFHVKTRVRKLFDEWKRRQLTGSQPHGARLTDMSREMDDVRKYLFGKSVHSEEGLVDALRNALRELGVVEEELDQLAKGIIAEARKDASRGTSVATDGAEIPAVGPRRFGSGD